MELHRKKFLQLLLIFVSVLLQKFTFSFKYYQNVNMNYLNTSDEAKLTSPGTPKYAIDFQSIIERNHSLGKRFVDTTFYGHPKTQLEIWERNFKVDEMNSPESQADSLVNLLNKIVSEYLDGCPPYILYDRYVEESEGFILQKFFQSIPHSFYHGKINARYKLENPQMFHIRDNKCKSYFLFLSDPQMTRKIIGPQTHDKVVVIARSSQWKLRDFLSSEVSSNIVNLLVIGESLIAGPSKIKPYVLYTHQLYSDGLGSNYPIILTSWMKNGLARPHINLFPQKFSRGFSGHSFMVAAVNQPPFIFRVKTLEATGMVTISWEGIEYRLMNLLGQHLNFSFEISEPKNSDILGSGEAVREDIQQGRADIGMAGAYITIDRLTGIDMSVGHSKDCASFITLASKALPKYRAIMGPFQWPVWVALTAIYLLGIFPLAFSDKLTLSHLIGNWGEMENMFWYVFGTFTNSLSFSGKSSWSNSEKMSTRLLIGFYWVFTIIITACYTGSIIAFVTLPAFPDTVDSVYDLLGLFFRVGTLDRGGWEKWFANSTHVPTARLYRKMEFVNTLEEGIGNVTQSFFWNYAFLGSRSQLEYLVQSNFTNAMSKRSALHLSEECFAGFQVAYAFPKNSVYSQRINDLILRIQQTGLMIKIENDVSWEMQRSSSGALLQASTDKSLREVIQEERQLTTADTEGMFLLMGAGYLIGALALISEVIGGFTNKCRQIMKRRRRSTSSCSSSGTIDHVRTEEETRQHEARKAQRKKERENNKPKTRFPGLENLVLTKATIKELYGGYRRQDPNIIAHRGQFMLETDAVSDDSLSDMQDISEKRRYSSDDDPLSNQTLKTHHEDIGVSSKILFNQDPETDEGSNEIIINGIGSMENEEELMTNTEDEHLPTVNELNYIQLQHQLEIIEEAPEGSEPSLRLVTATSKNCKMIGNYNVDESFGEEVNNVENATDITNTI